MPTFFHLAPVSQIDAILREGLDPRHSHSSLAAVFLAGSVGTAENYANMKDEPCAVLKVEFPDALLSSLEADNYELRDLIADLDAEGLKKHGLWEGADWDDCSWEQSLAICDQVACLVRIPPDCLTRVNPPEAHHEASLVDRAKHFLDSLVAPKKGPHA